MCKCRPPGEVGAEGDGSTVTGSHVSTAGRDGSICQEGSDGEAGTFVC